MDTSEFMVEDVKLVIPDFLGDYWPHHCKIADFPTFCGPGGGFADVVVPDHLYGLSVSAACFIHDICWSVSRPTWADFHHSNSIFLHNILSIVEARSIAFLKPPRRRLSVLYFMAVDTAGSAFFWHDKEALGYFDNPIDNPIVVERLYAIGVNVNSSSFALRSLEKIENSIAGKSPSEGFVPNQ